MVSNVVLSMLWTLLGSTQFNVALRPKSSSNDPGAIRFLPYPNAQANKRRSIGTIQRAEAFLLKRLPRAGFARLTNSLVQLGGRSPDCLTYKRPILWSLSVIA